MTKDFMLGILMGLTLLPAFITLIVWLYHKCFKPIVKRLYGYVLSILSASTKKEYNPIQSQLTPETKAMIEQSREGITPDKDERFISFDGTIPTRKVTLVPPSQRRATQQPESYQHIDVKQACKEHEDNYSSVMTREQQEYLVNQELAKQQQVKPIKQPAVLPQTRTIQQQRQLIADFLAEKSQTLEADKTLASKYNTTVVTLEKYATDDQMDQWESIRAICMAKPRTPSKAQQAEMNSRFNQYGLSNAVENQSNASRKVVEK